MMTAIFPEVRKASYQTVNLNIPDQTVVDKFNEFKLVIYVVNVNSSQHSQRLAYE